MFRIELETLFSPGRIGNVKIKNKIVRSATFEGSAQRGAVSDQLIATFTELARGGTGLIITGATAVDLKSTGSLTQVYLFDDSFISGHKKLVDAVHEYSEVKIATQLNHMGRQASHPKYDSVAPSSILYKLTNRIPRELTIEEIKEIIKQYVSAGRRAYESGYDMVQLHSAHGYLLSTFVSPYTNKRDDEFGGNTQKRTKILVDIYNQLRDEVGKNFPIIIKLQTQDFVPGGLTLEEGKEIAEILVDTGYDAIEPSGGLIEKEEELKDMYPSKRVKSPEEENYFFPAVKKLKPIMKDRPIFLMGGIKNPISAEKILREKSADFISLSRPLIYEPDLPNRWKSGDLSPARCVSCNSCYMTMLTGAVHCVVKKKIERRKKREQKKNQKK